MVHTKTYLDSKSEVEKRLAAASLWAEWRYETFEECMEYVDYYCDPALPLEV